MISIIFIYLNEPPLHHIGRGVGKCTWTSLSSIGCFCVVTDYLIIIEKIFTQILPHTWSFGWGNINPLKQEWTQKRERAEIIVPCEQMVALIQFINWIFSLELKWNTLYKYKVHWFHSIILVEYDQNSNIPNYSTYVVVKLGCQFWWISQVYWYLFSMFT